MSSTLRLEKLRMPVASPQAQSPLPMLRGTDIHASVRGGELDVEYGRISHLLPYHAQDDYSREPVDRELSVRLPYWKTSGSPRLSCWSSAAGCGRWSIVRTAANFCTGHRCCRPRTSRCATPGSPAGWSGTSAPPGTGR
nr:hypothetical protein [Fodinicola feengrottensis]